MNKYFYHVFFYEITNGKVIEIVVDDINIKMEDIVNIIENIKKRKEMFVVIGDKALQVDKILAIEKKIKEQIC